MPRNHFSEQQEGFVLVTVLWLLVILSVITMGFSHRAMMERRMAWYGMDQAQAQAMARGAVNRALLELSNKDRFASYLGQEQYDGRDQRWARPTNLLNEAGYFSINDEENFAEDICRYTITDCESRITLNDAPRDLLENMDVFYFKAIDAIMARRVRGDGSEQLHRFVSVDEVLTIEEANGTDEEMWFGTAEILGLRSLLTIWGIGGDGLINVNTASREVLAMIPELDGNLLDDIVAFRAGSDEVLGTNDDRSFRDLRNMWRDLGVSAEALAPILEYCKTNSQWFKITTHATRRRGKISAYCTVIVEMQGGDAIIKDWKEGIIGS